MFDAGAIAFKFLTAGKAQFVRDQADAEAATRKTAKATTDAATATDKAGKVAEKTAKTQKQLAAEAKRAAEEQKKAAEDLGRGLLVAGAAITTMVGISVAASARFDQAMSQTSAALMATTQEQKELREAALQAGADSAYSATEAANAQEELGKAGLETAEIVGGALNGALALAAAGQVELARSAEIMATTLKQYRLPAEQAGHVSDLLAAGAGKAQGSVEDLSLALGYAGPVAAGLGISLEETTGVLGLFASNGILADRAGTGLRGMLMSLTSPSAIAARTMKEYGVEVFNADGSMKSMAEVADQLKGAFAGLTEEERSNALGRIFGNEQITTARILYEGGAQAVEEWTSKVDDAGYAERQASMRTDNLLGDLERLGGAFETVLIKGGTGANDTLRGLVQTVEGAVDWFGQLPDPVQQTAIGLGVALGAVALFSGGALTLRTRLTEMKATLDTVNASMSRTAMVGGAVGLAVTAIAVVVGSLAMAHQQAQQKAEDYASTLEDGTQAITESTRTMVAENLKAAGAFEWAEKAGVSIGAVTKAALGNKDAMDEVKKSLDGYSISWDGLVTDMNGPVSQAEADRVLAAQKLVQAIDGESESIARGAQEARQMEEATAAAAEETEGAAAASESAAGAYLAEAGALDDLNRELDALIEKLLEANGQNRDAISANSDYQQSLDDLWQHVQSVKDGVEGYGGGLDTATQAGRDNMAMLTQLAEDAEQAAEAQLALDGDTEKFIGTLSSSREELARAAQEMGLSEDAAKALADQILAIPDQKEIDILAETTFAQQQIDSYISKNTGREIIVKIGTSRVAQGAGGAGGITFADGGVVSHHANGSVSENHVAQIAQAGEWRIWAEDETGGESYVPHALSKRARSEAIMAETARRFGGTYIPAGASRHADGSVSAAGAVTAAGADVTFTGDFVFTGMTPVEVRALFREELNKWFSRGGLR